MEYINCPICNIDDTKLIYSVKDYNLGIDLHKTFQIVRCNRCGFVYVNPRPDNEEIKKYYPEEYYSRASGILKFDDKEIERTRKMFSFSINLIDKTKEKGKILDIGCGEGIFLNFMKEKGWDVYGCDVSQFALEFAKKQFGIKVFKGTVRDIPFPDKYFDAITMFHVLEHIHDPLQDILRIKDLLKDNGIFLISVPNFSSFSRVLFGKFWVPLHVPRHLNHFTPSSLKKLLSLGDLSLTKVFHSSHFLKSVLFISYSNSLRNFLINCGLFPAKEKAVSSDGIPIQIRTKEFSFPGKQLFHFTEDSIYRVLEMLSISVGKGSMITALAKKK